MSERVADICLILEGSYPHVAGGVSTWTHDLIKANPDLSFHVLALTADGRPRPLAHELPGNVVGMTIVPLQQPPRGKEKLERLGRLIEAIRGPLAAMQSDGGLREYAELDRLIGPRRDQLGRATLMNSEAAFRMTVGLYRDTLPNASFLEYFWGLRSLLSGLFSTLLAPLPPARVYHAISTGYAGLVAARARLETGRSTLLTEHGIYTNERRIEILMADWLFDGASATLAVEGERRELRDLWLDSFAAFSRVCYSACDLIITLYGGNQVMQRRGGAPPEKMRVVPNGVDYETYSKVVRDEGDRPPTIALLGRVVPIKDVKTYIRAAGLLRESVPDLKAMILGPTDEDPDYVAECRALVSALDLDRTVIFAGKVEPADWFGRLDAIVLTSVSEAQPLVILEAGASGVPTVATNVGSCSELIYGRDDEEPPLGEGGAVTPLASPVDTANALREILLDPPRRERLGRVIRERVRLHYDKRVIDRIYREIYDEARARPDRLRMFDRGA